MAKVGLDFAQKHSAELKHFVYEALQHGYGSEENSNDDGFDADDGKSVITYESSDKKWRYEDIFLGGEPYSGISIVYYEGVACWTMTYWGQTLPGVADKHFIYDCLMPALMHTPLNYPFRGPSSFHAENGLHYTNIWHGDIVQFYGEESIKNSDEECLFETHYRGGIVNLK